MWLLIPCDYLSMLGLKIIHISKSGYWYLTTRKHHSPIAHMSKYVWRRRRGCSWVHSLLIARKTNLQWRAWYFDFGMTPKHRYNHSTKNTSVCYRFSLSISVMMTMTSLMGLLYIYWAALPPSDPLFLIHKLYQPFWCVASHYTSPDWITIYASMRVLFIIPYYTFRLG